MCTFQVQVFQTKIKRLGVWVRDENIVITLEAKVQFKAKKQESSRRDQVWRENETEPCGKLSQGAGGKEAVRDLKTKQNKTKGIILSSGIVPKGAH